MFGQTWPAKDSLSVSSFNCCTGNDNACGIMKHG